MKVSIDTQKRTIKYNNKSLSLYSKSSFEFISDLWVNLGWNQKYSYTFSWLGRPIIQLPEDIIRIQELIFKIKPTKIIETGIAHGGTSILFASLIDMMKIKGKVIGIDIKIRKKNLKAIKKHPYSKYISLIEGSSIDDETFKKVKKHIKSHDKIFVFLDSNHTCDHVYKELLLYANLVTLNSFIVVCDGIMQTVSDTPRGIKKWQKDNPLIAIKKFLKNNNKFALHEPKWPFNESKLSKRITHSPMCFLKRIK